MKLLILGSGGDAPGMNRYIAKIYKKFGDKVFAVKAGYRGLIDGQIYPLSNFQPMKYKNKSGCCIKSSRCPEFKEDKVFKKAMKNLQDFDYVIILGGNGSLKGAERIAAEGVKTVFVPCTIDNDVEISEYSIGFHTAVKECCYVIRSTMPSMEAFGRSCVFEVMGRHHDAIARNVGSIISADTTVCSEKDIDYKSISKIIKENQKDDKSSCIIIRENVINMDEFLSKLKQECKNCDIKSIVIGHVQRGGKPTKYELRMADGFYKKTLQALKNKESSHAICFKNGKFDDITNM